MSADASYGAGLAEYLGARAHALVGSTYILGAGKDTDWLFLVDTLTQAVEFLRRKGWACESEEYDELGQFLSFRGPGSVNALVTTDADFYEGFIRASEVCKYLAARGYYDIGQREVRVRIHAIVRDGLPA